MADWSHGEMHWNELMTHDVEKAKRFYAETVGWSFEPMSMPNGTYWIAKMGDTYVGGLFPMSGSDFDGVPDHWMPYVAVDDVDARLKKAVAAGAQTCREPFVIPGVGRIAILREPGGAMVGWMTPPRS
jgi:predicted enzyme related to lactoylglutathione lyase